MTGAAPEHVPEHSSGAAPTVRIRPMRLRDIDAVLPLENELFAGDPPWTADIFKSELAGAPTTRWYVVAEVGRDIVGYAGLRLPGAPREPADVHTIAVAKAWQRHGIGTRLMRTLIDEARAHDADTLLLEVREDNAAALAFYPRFGFERIAVRRGYYGGRRDGLVLQRHLWTSDSAGAPASGDNR